MKDINGNEAICKIVKDCEGRLAMHMLNRPGSDEPDGYYASEELEGAILEELKKCGEERAIKIINSCNRA